MGATAKGHNDVTRFSGRFTKMKLKFYGCSEFFKRDFLKIHKGETFWKERNRKGLIILDLRCGFRLDDGLR